MNPNPNYVSFNYPTGRHVSAVGEAAASTPNSLHPGPNDQNVHVEPASVASVTSPGIPPGINVDIGSGSGASVTSPSVPHGTGLHKRRHGVRERGLGRQDDQGMIPVDDGEVESVDESPYFGSMIAALRRMDIGLNGFWGPSQSSFHGS
jgi:hypothetical protein